MLIPSFEQTDQLQRVRSTLTALEAHLRTSGLGALELGQPLDLEKLAKERQEEAKLSFEKRKRTRDAASAVQGVLKAT